MTTAPLVPTATPHVLPFDRLSPADFERLCLALVQAEGYEKVEHPGLAGNEQGRDLTARRGAVRIAFQCKRVLQLGPADARAEVAKLLALPEDERPHEVIFLASCRVSEATRSAARKAAGGAFTCEVWAVTELDTRLRRHPEIIRDFFRPVAVEAPPSPAEVLEAALAASATHLDAALRKVGRKFRPELYVARSLDPAVCAFLTSRQPETAAAKVLIATAGTGKTNLSCHMAGVLRGLRVPCVLLLGSDSLRDRRTLIEDVTQALGCAPGEDWRPAFRSLSAQGVPVVILLDGINEARDVELMQHALRELLAEAAPFLVRAFLTCRDIYWMFLQGDWTDAIPTEILRPDLYHYEEGAWPEARDRYFSFYKIRGTLLGEADRQCRHPLLFRFFCEAYEGEDVSTVEQIRLRPLFERYLERKVAQIVRARAPQLRADERVITILDAIAAEMLDTRVKSVPEARIPALTQDGDHLDRGSVYVRLLDEDIVIEEVPDERHASLRRRVRFVYEAFFEFMLARVLAGRWEHLPTTDLLDDLMARLEPSDGLPNVLGALQFLDDFFRRRGINLWRLLLRKGAAFQSLVLQSLSEMRPEEIEEEAREAFQEIATDSPANLRASALSLLRKPALRTALDPRSSLLVRALRSDPRAEVRAAAQAVLLEDWSELTDEQLDDLARTLFDRARDVRHQALKSWRKTRKKRPEPVEDNQLRAHMTRAIQQAFTSPRALVRSSAAEAIRADRDPWGRPLLLQGLRDESSWVRSACLRTLARLKEPTAEEEAAVARCLEDPERRVRIAAARVGRSWASEGLMASLLRRIAEEEDPGVLASLLTAAGGGGPAAVPVLRERLADPHPWVFERAGWGLCEILGVPALDEVVQALRRRGDVAPWPWHSLEKALDSGHPLAPLSGAERLIRLLDSGFRSSQIRPETGAFVLGVHAWTLLFGTAEAEGRVRQTIHGLVSRIDDPLADAFVEGLSLEIRGIALAEIVGSADLADALRRRARHPDRRITAPAVYLLVAAEVPLAAGDLERFANSPVQTVRMGLARGLAMVPNAPSWQPEAFLALIPAAIRDPAERGPVLEAVLQALSRDAPFLPPAEDEDPHISEHQAACAERLRTLLTRTLPLLLDLVACLAPEDKRRARLLQLLAAHSQESGSPEDRARILVLLSASPSAAPPATGTSTGPWLEEILTRALGDRSTVVVRAALDLLTDLGAEAVRAHLPAVVSHVESRKRAVRIRVCQNVALLGRQDAEAPLLQLLADPERSVRRQAVALLPRVLGTDAAPRLLLALRDPAPVVRIEACLQLASLPAPGVVEGLLDRLKDPHSLVRRQALRSLAALDRGLALRHVGVLLRSTGDLDLIQGDLNLTPQEDAALRAEMEALELDDIPF